MAKKTNREGFYLDAATNNIAWQPGRNRGKDELQEVWLGATVEEATATAAAEIDKSIAALQRKRAEIADRLRKCWLGEHLMSLTDRILREKDKLSAEDLGKLMDERARLMAEYEELKERLSAGRKDEDA